MIHMEICLKIRTFTYKPLRRCIMTELEEDEELRRILERKKREILEQAASGADGGDSEEAQAESRVVDLDDSSFEDFIRSHRAVVVDFWAPWCAPCFLVSPIIDELSLTHTKVAFARVNADENPVTSSKYYVMSLPTIMFFLDGEEIDRIVGAVPEDVLEERVAWLESRL